MELGWIDFSKTERNKILSVLDLLSQEGTLDELGIAPVRDGFSNLFFPGTSTIQTRAKYFFIVPYALKDLELSDETNPNKLLKKLNEIERACGEMFLQHNKDENGIIGKRSLQHNKWVKRTPADIYWSGLKKYGIFTGGNISLGEYLKAFCGIKKQKSTLTKLGNHNDNAEENECDDKNAGNVFKKQFWKMPLYTTKWFDDLSMELSYDEGQFLKEQIIICCPESLLAYILKNNIVEILDCNSFKELQYLMIDLPAQIQEDFELASAFSDFLYVVRTVYNIIISDGQNEIANDELDILYPQMEQRANIDIDFILNKLQIYNNPLRNFLKQMQNCMLTKDIAEMKKHINNREVLLKGPSRAKTNHPGEMIDVNAWIGGKELDYRFFNAKTIIRDIFESEGKVNVKS